jgi:tetratricopeptide (TPR) repeat protein
LAFALGHEIAHIALRHHINAYCQRVQSSPESPEHVMLETVLSRLSSNQEIEADRYGALYSVRAGFRYSSSHEALGKLQRASPATTGNAVHPEYDRRISDLKRFKRELDLSLESFHAGKAALRAGEIDEAISLFAYFVAEFPRSVPGQVNLGAAYLSRVRDKAGTPLGLAEALPILPDPGVVIRGTYDRIDLEQAGAHFARALRVDPDDATAHAGLGLVQVRLGELQDARRHLDDAVALEPDNPDLLLCSGNVFFFMDDYDQAKARYLAALSLRVGWADAKKNLALSYEKLGMRNEAAALWSELYDDNRYRSEARRRIRDLEEQR